MQLNLCFLKAQNYITAFVMVGKVHVTSCMYGSKYEPNGRRRLRHQFLTVQLCFKMLIWRTIQQLFLFIE